MEKKKIAKLFALGAAGLLLAACGGSGATSTPDGDTEPAVTDSSDGGEDTGGGEGETSSTAAGLESITILDEYKVQEVGIGEVIYLNTSWYTLSPSGLPASQRRCDLSIERGEEFFTEEDGEFTAAAIGTGVFRISSRVNPEIYDTFTVNVVSTFFARTDGYSVVDLTHENDEEHPYVTTRGVNSELIVNGIESTKWYAQTDITIHSVNSSESYPKFGIFSRNSNGSLNRITFFLNAWIGSSNNSSWNAFGMCEVSGQDDWAWNTGVTNDVARHNDGAYYLPDGQMITYETTFTMGFLRDGLRYYMYVNGLYAGEFDILESIVAADEPSNPGFFQFNSSCTFSDYSATQDEATVDAMLEAIETHNLITTWADD